MTATASVASPAWRGWRWLTRAAACVLVVISSGLLLPTIAVVLGAVSVVFQSFGSGAKIATTEARIRSLEAALMEYKTLNGYYPGQRQGLEALVNPPSGEPLVRRWKKFVQPETLDDPWNRKFQFRIPGTHNSNGIDVFSFGPDGFESADDIGNW